jgi:hypothetical protein
MQVIPAFAGTGGKASPKPAPCVLRENALPVKAMGGSVMANDCVTCGATVDAGDAARITQMTELAITQGKGSESLVFEMA